MSVVPKLLRSDRGAHCAAQMQSATWFQVTNDVTNRDRIFGQLALSEAASSHIRIGMTTYFC